MHPGVQKGGHNTFCPIIQLGLELMEKWALHFPKHKLYTAIPLNRVIGFDITSGEHFGLLEERFCNDSYLVNFFLNLTSVQYLAAFDSSLHALYRVMLIMR